MMMPLKKKEKQTNLDWLVEKEKGLAERKRTRLRIGEMPNALNRVFLIFFRFLFG